MDIIRMPPVITARKPEEAIREMQRYLWQFAEQVQHALEESKRVEYEIKTAAGKAAQQQKDTPAATFGKVKDLIIKSAEIVDAYRTEITKTLDGQYVAASSFGTFREQTTAQITETNKNVTQNYNMIQRIATNVSGLESGIRQFSAYIRTGLLYEGEDGIARYGVEIGEQVEKDGANVFRKFARLVSDRLSFFDQNDIEVAYISDRKLYITSAEVQEFKAKQATIQSLLIGEYVLWAGNDGHLTLS
ncbi:MAG: hypothetical protein ACI3XG_02945 [Faecousia sp.]